MRFRKVAQLFFILGLVVFGVSAANAQQIQGTVRNATTQQPIRGALVRCSGIGGTNNQLTDPNGRFFFRVSPGHYDCSVKASGFRDEQQSKDLLDTQTSEFLDFRLRIDAGKVASGGSPSAESASNVPAKAREEFEKGTAAVALGKKENFEEGVVHLEKALTIYPRYLEAEFMLGTTYVDLQQYDKAEQALKKTIEIDPKAVNAYFALGETYLREKKNEDAEKTLLQGLQIDARTFQGHLTLARVYVDMAAKLKDETQNRPLRVKAYDQINEALKYNSDSAMAHWIKGNLLLSVGRDQDAQHELEESLRLDPKGPLAEKAKSLVEKIKKALEAEKKP